MVQSLLPASLTGYRVHLVGIKGTGMTALAEILQARGADLTGSDTPDRFYTDRILTELEIPFREGFAAGNVGADTRLVIYSAAYSPEENVELQQARALGIPLLTYPEALGQMSAGYDSSGIAGTHGKTTTTALAGACLQALKLPVTVLAGSEVRCFGNRSSLILGDRYLVAETCEYRRHFLHFRPRRIVITSLEAEHLDYFRDLEDVRQAFREYGLLLPPGGEIIYNQDDPGAAALTADLRSARKDIAFVPYGCRAEGPFRMSEISSAAGKTSLRLGLTPEPFVLRIPGIHAAYDAAAAVTLACRLLAEQRGGAAPGDLAAIRAALEGFDGLRRRSEIIGEARSVLFMDDYGHHPTEIATTLAGLKAFYPDRRLVADFMPHTYSRTRKLLEDFARCFSSADTLVLHKIYASAREQAGGAVSGRTLFDAVRRHHPEVHYFHEPADALPFLERILRAGDLFVTMGAGDNWKLGQDLYHRFSGAQT
jgi:UDP-N-acetylmuramate--alanine ligase